MSNIYGQGSNWGDDPAYRTIEVTALTSDEDFLIGLNENEETTITLKQLFEWHDHNEILDHDYSDFHVPLTMWQLTKLFGSASVVK